MGQVNERPFKSTSGFGQYIVQYMVYCTVHEGHKRPKRGVPNVANTRDSPERSLLWAGGGKTGRRGSTCASGWQLDWNWLTQPVMFTTCRERAADPA
eukprot:1192664-Prorocentrum_minimum.AAC.3